MEIDKSKMLDSNGKPITQSLFLEIGYSDFAVYTLKDNDFEYEGRLLPSIKRLYIETEDPTEYVFANKYFLGWKHWQRICLNKTMSERIEEWRFELALKLRARGIAGMIESAKKGSYQAVLWLASNGWDKREAGRPSKEEQERDKRVKERLQDEYSADIVRLVKSE